MMATFAEIKEQITPGTIIAVRRYAWTKRRTALLVTAVEELTRTTLVSGKAYSLGIGVVRSKRANVLMFPDTQVEIIEKGK